MSSNSNIYMSEENEDVEQANAMSISSPLNTSTSSLSKRKKTKRTEEKAAKIDFRCPEVFDMRMITHERSGSVCYALNMTASTSNFSSSAKETTTRNINIKDLIKRLRFYSEENIENYLNLEINLLEKEERLWSDRNPSYMTLQKLITPEMRKILLDWLCEITSQLGFKRETYHLSVILVDVFLSKTENIQTCILQLVGVTCLVIASKYEEIIIPRVNVFSHSTDYAFSSKQILDFELQILEVLNWRIDYPTLAFWANYFMTKWDEFSTNFRDVHAYDMPLYLRGIVLPKFRTRDSLSEFYLYRNFFQILDVMVLEIITIAINERKIIGALIYILIGLFLEIFDLNLIIQSIREENDLLGINPDYNLVLNKYFFTYMGYEVDFIADEINYIKRFVLIKFDYCQPRVPRDENNEEISKSFENFLQTQTHSQYNIQAMEIINSVLNSS